MNVKRFVIVGAGAIGGCIGGLLQQSGTEVILVARGKHGEAIRKEGLVIKFPGRAVCSNPICVSSVNEVDWASGDVCLIATKLNDAKGVMMNVLEQGGRSIPLVCAFNGLQGERWAAELFETVASIMIWMPSTHLFPGDVRVYGETCPGVLDIGPIRGDRAARLSQSVAQILRNASFDSQVRHKIECWKNAKLITNLGNTAQALILDEWKSVANAARIEGESIVEQLKIDRVPTQELLERCKHIRLDKIDGEERSGGSTWQSLQRGKALESEWIEGEIVRMAHHNQRSAPINQKLVALANERTCSTADKFFASVESV